LQLKLIQIIGVEIRIFKKIATNSTLEKLVSVKLIQIHFKFTLKLHFEIIVFKKIAPIGAFEFLKKVSFKSNESLRYFY